MCNGGRECGSRCGHGGGGEERGHPPVLLNQDRRATGEEGKWERF